MVETSCRFVLFFDCISRFGPHQPADLQGVRHQSVTDFLRGAPLGGSAGDEH